jgi:uncharacterized protein YjbI with pentapeptide repeats
MSPSRRHPVLWYTRRNAIVQGPFPAGLITRYIVLGRITETDELSQDLVTWKPLAELPELIPDFLHENHAAAQHRLEATRRWENERTRDDRRRERVEISEERRSIRDRRMKADTDQPRALQQEDFSEWLVRARRHRFLSAAIAAGILIVVVTALVYQGPRPASEGPDCRRPAQPDVNWENCAMEGRTLVRVDLNGARMRNMALSRANLHFSRLSGADLSFTNLSVADLRQANLEAATLTGTSLRGADLSFADLRRADLSYADLQGARLEGVQLQGAQLDNAVWVDGSVCVAGSVGRCLVMPTPPSARE